MVRADPNILSRIAAGPKPYPNYMNNFAQGLTIRDLMDEQRERRKKAQFVEDSKKLIGGIFQRGTMRNPDTGKLEPNVKQIQGELFASGNPMAIKAARDWQKELSAIESRKQARMKEPYGLQPIYGTGEEGKPVAMRMEKGGLRKLDLPEGVSELTPGVTKMDLGDKYAIIDKGGNLIGYQKKGLRPGELPGVKGAQAAAVQKATGQISPKEKQLEGKAAVTSTVDDIKKLYEELRSLGGVIDVEKSGFSNVMTRIGASKIGQAVQTAIGTEVQSARNKIEMLRPALIQQIRQATQMGAKGMDSEKELEFYLKTATDTKVDFQANMNALAVLNDSFGLGMDLPPGEKVYKEPSQTKSDAWKQLKDRAKKGDSKAIEFLKSRGVDY